MIISASRRTDIPAFYSPWLLNRLKEGFVLVRNPMNPNMVNRVTLKPELTDCIVFWTKNPRPLMGRLDQLKDYRYYFLFTITPYSPDLERHLPPKEEIIETFIELSRRLGREKVVWRYDPILLSDTVDADYHLRHFQTMAARLGPYTERCITSFLDMYKKCERNLKGIHIKMPGPEEMTQLTAQLNTIAREQGMELVTCAEDLALSPIGVPHGRCIDDTLIRRICGYPLTAKKDPHQRKTCLCVESIDIGAYHTCPHICLYCYANSDADTVHRNMAGHDPHSPLLTGHLTGQEKIVDRKAVSLKKTQGTLF